MDTSGGAAVEPASHPETWVAQALGATVETGSMRATSVTWDAATGGFVAVWGSVTDHYHLDGALLHDGMADPVQAVDDGAYDAFEPDIAGDGQGTILAVYEDDRDGGGSCCRELYAQTFSTASGVLEQVGPDWNFTNAQPVEQWTPALAWDSGVYFVAYSDDRDNVGGDERRLYGRTLLADGTIGTELKLGADSLWQTAATVADSGGNGRFLVVWGDYDPVDGSLDAGYRARIVDGDGVAVTDVLTIVRYGNQIWDRPAAAWNPWRQAWLVVWTEPYGIHRSWIGLDGSITAADTTIVAPDTGAGAPRLVYSPTTNAFLLAYHAWWTTDGFLQPLDTFGTPVGDPLPLTASTPPLGTFWQAVAVAGDRSEAVVVPCLDYATVAASTYAGG